MILFVVLSTWYINRFLAPTALKNVFLKSISQVVDRPVSVGSLRFNIINGFVLKDLTIYEPDGITPFIQARRVTTSLLLVPLFKEKKIIIPSIYIDSPHCIIVKKPDMTWNFLAPSLIKKAASAQKLKKSGFILLIQGIRLDGGTISFADNTRNPPYTRNLVGLTGNVVFSLKESAVNFKTVGKLDTPQKTDVAFSGSYSLLEDTLDIKAAMKNVPLAEPYIYFYKAALLGDLKGGVADVSATFKINRDRTSDLMLNGSVRDINASAWGVTLAGDLDVGASAHLDFAEGPKADYRISLYLKGPTLRGIYLLNEFSQLTGKIEITNKSISTEAMDGIAYTTPVRFSGGVADFANPRLDVSARADIDLTHYRDFIPEQLRPGLADLNLQGSGELTLRFTDLLSDPQPAQVIGELRLKNASLTTPLLPSPLTQLWGHLAFENNILYISRLSFSDGARDYMLDAKVSHFEQPDIKMVLKRKDLSVDSRFEIIKDSVHIVRASGTYLNSSYALAGTIDNLKNPDVRLQGTLGIDLLDLRAVFPRASEQLARFNVRGRCSADFLLNGPLKDAHGPEATVHARAGRINIWDLKLDDVAMELRLKDRYLVVPAFTAQPYGGMLQGGLEADFSQPNPPYAISVAANGIDLSRLILDTDFRNRPASGKATTKWTLRGYGMNPDTIKGEGLLLIKGTYLWEMPLLRGVADLLFLPNLSSVVFDEVSADFSVTNKTVSTSNLALHSQNVGLLGEGYVTFDGALDLAITTSISEDYLRSTTEFQRLAGILLAEAGNFIGSIKIGGTLKKPEYKYIPLPIDRILKDKLKNLLGGFF